MRHMCIGYFKVTTPLKEYSHLQHQWHLPPPKTNLLFQNLKLSLTIIIFHCLYRTNIFQYAVPLVPVPIVAHNPHHK